MLENRKTYRIPFRAKFIFGLGQGVFTGNALNISAGGIFVSSLRLLPRDSLCKILFQLRPNELPINMEALVKRVSQSTPDPEHNPGLGFQFVGSGQEEVKRRVEAYMEESRKNYEVASTILSSGEPDLHSLQRFLSNMHLPHFQDLGELKNYLERVLRSIELVENAQAMIDNL